MRMLGWMSGRTRKYMIRNENLINNLGIAPIEDKKRENDLRWFGHVIGDHNSFK